MPFIAQMRGLRSVSIVGLAKNAGKTETLNYVVRRLAESGLRVALTSIGIDGERVDQVTQTDKPEIVVPSGMTVVTSESHYAARELTAVVQDVSAERTSLGRMVTARSVIPGRILLAGPASTPSLRRLLARLRELGIDLTLVDGALSRLSLASPSVTDGLILATGAAVSANMQELLRQTAYVHQLINLPAVEESLRRSLEPIARGVWAIDEDGQVHDLELPSVFLMGRAGRDLFRYGRRLYVAGAVSDRVFEILRQQEGEHELIVQDFTRIFAQRQTFNAFVQLGGRVRCLSTSNLLGITVNPQAPSGYRLDSERLCDLMRETLQVPVYDVRRL